MSLPDTIFIFLLALIIFGPKKLPEIGRQIGRLVGEFRRASNEFKFQIEEELRQADITESQKKIAAEPMIQPPASEQLPDTDPVATTEPSAVTESSEPEKPLAVIPAAGAEPRDALPLAVEANLESSASPADQNSSTISVSHAENIIAPSEVEATHG